MSICMHTYVYVQDIVTTVHVVSTQNILRLDVAKSKPSNIYRYYHSVKNIGRRTQFGDPLKKKNWDEFTGGIFFKKNNGSRRALQKLEQFKSHLCETF